MKAACGKRLVTAKGGGEEEEGRGLGFFMARRSYAAADALGIWMSGPLGQSAAQHGRHQFAVPPVLVSPGQASRAGAVQAWFSGEDLGSLHGCSRRDLHPHAG